MRTALTGRTDKQNRLSAKKSTQASAGSAAMDKAQLAQLLTTAIIAMRSERRTFFLRLEKMMAHPCSAVHCRGAGELLHGPGRHG